MSILVALHHTTQYTYDRPVTLGTQLVRLRPAPHCQIPIEAYSLKIKPEDHFINWQQDPFSNFVANIVVPHKVHSFTLEVDLIAKIKATNPFSFFLEDEIKNYPFHYAPYLKKQLFPYFEINDNSPAMQQWLNTIDCSPQKTIDLLVNINKKINQEINYVIRLEPGTQDPETTLTLKTGSCRDMAWLLCETLRHLGLATRFCSGYLIQLKLDEKPLDGPVGPEKDIVDLHAWAEVYIPGAGWIGFDSTSGLLTGEGHIPLCATPDCASASPVSGTVDECESQMQFHMSMARIHQEPRSTQPYFGHEWQEIQHLATQVDADLMTHDVRLTMGGEPTFIAIDDKESPEWTLAALGEDKKQRALSLLNKLKHHFSPGGMVHYGQGKWYGGEPLPRWSLDCYWRVDQQPIWKNEKLLVIEQTPLNTLADGKQFIQILVNMLNLNADCIVPAFENSTMPTTTEIGYVLPLGWNLSTNQWASQAWPFSTTAPLILLAGDSPMGLRLPLHQLPPVDEKAEIIPEASPFATQQSLPTSEDYLHDMHQRRSSSPVSEKKISAVRTALCIEIRNQTVCIFLPPLARLEHYLELIAAIEWTATELQLPVRLEGYSPPQDARLHYFKITPDPGVIEVNIHPSKNWPELVTTMETLYTEAKRTRLTAEKYLMDGRKVGTGGGNHITLGGMTPSDSPFLRRPDVLQSMVTFWQHHPSLSYLFSGLFIGPTSQAPRVDEARHEALYELEIAFAHLPTASTNGYWKIDRLLRNLLVDMTGNTHRAEFCIDKLYSPHAESGRQGLLELRAFEMPPHPQMCLIQYLLVRALIVTFWQQPYHPRLIRWGTALHDRFMLPYCLWQDFNEVIHYLQNVGYGFSIDWFKPFLAFRFPTYGQVRVHDIELELRMALEPWHVLGEETQSGTTSRSVDSALERLQVRVNHFNLERYALTCNGYPVPLQSTAQQGEYIAGVRFKAWDATWTLHPTIPVHTPLVFDIIDRYHQRSLGGCTYHTQHPGGEAYEKFPINAREAESRMKACFEPFGHTPGTVAIPPALNNVEYPYTLDLRQTKE